MAKKNGQSMTLNLSIIIPAYNVEEWIEECLNSIAAIKRDDFEVIIVNDGSTDKTMQIAQKLSVLFKNYILLDQKNQGASVARNLGLSHAKGEYIFFCDSDDYIDPKEFVDFLDKTLISKVDISIGNGLVVKGNTINGLFKKESRIIKTENLSGPSFYKIANEAKEFIIPPWNKLFRNDFLKINGITFLPSIIHEDEEFSCKAFCLAQNVRYIGSRFYFYRLRPGSVTRSSFHKYQNKNSIPAFNKILHSLFSFLNLNQWNATQKEVIVHAIYKCYTEILRRELYLAKEKASDLNGVSSDRKEINDAIKSVNMTVIQRVNIWRLKFKILFLRKLK